MDNEFEDKMNSNKRVGEFDYCKKSYFQERAGEFDYRNKSYFHGRVVEFDYRKKDHNGLTPETPSIAPATSTPKELESTLARNRDAITKFAMGVMATNILNKIR